MLAIPKYRIYIYAAVLITAVIGQYYLRVAIKYNPIKTSHKTGIVIISINGNENRIDLPDDKIALAIQEINIGRWRIYCETTAFIPWCSDSRLALAPIGIIILDGRRYNWFGDNRSNLLTWINNR